MKQQCQWVTSQPTRFCIINKLISLSQSATFVTLGNCTCIQLFSTLLAIPYCMWLGTAGCPAPPPCARGHQNMHEKVASQDSITRLSSIFSVYGTIGTEIARLMHLRRSRSTANTILLSTNTHTETVAECTFWNQLIAYLYTFCHTSRTTTDLKSSRRVNGIVVVLTFILNLQGSLNPSGFTRCNHDTLELSTRVTITLVYCTTD